MRQPVSLNLEEKVAAALTDPESELWFPHLTYDLAQMGWRKLKDDIGLDRLNYSTARVFTKNPNVIPEITSHILFRDSEDSVRDLVLIEELPEAIARYYKNTGVVFYEPEEIYPVESVNSEIINCLCAAFDVIKQAPALWRTVVDLIRVIQIIKPESDDYDVSFSVPHIPFSIFVSVPQTNNPINSLRVAEALVHEAMHLQLTLIENIIPLVSGNDKKFYSPWKEEFRNSQGVLHAIYVFRVIEQFFAELPEQYLGMPEIGLHVTARKLEIHPQIDSVKKFAEQGDLTSIGKTFARNLTGAIRENS